MRSEISNHRVLRLILVIVALVFIGVLRVEAAGVEKSLPEDPVKLARECDAAWRAGDHERGQQIADKLKSLHERAAPAVRELVATLDEPVQDVGPDGNPYVLLLNLQQILASIGAPAAVPLAERLAAGNAPLSPTFLRNQGEASNSRYAFVIGVFDQLGVSGSLAILELVRLLESPSVEIRATACRCLSPSGPLAREALPKIRLLCSDADAGCRRDALRALVALDVDTNEIRPHLAAAVADSSPIVQNQAVESIAVLGSRVAPLSGPLTSLLTRTNLEGKPGDEEDLDGKMPKSAGKIFMAAWEIGRPDMDPPAVDPDDVLRALRAVGLHDPKECEQVADLLIQSGSKMGSGRRSHLGDLLSAAGQMAHPAITRWLSAERDTDDAVEIAAVRTALQVRPQIADLLPILFARAAYFGGKYVEKEKDPFAWLISAGVPRVKSLHERETLSLVGPLIRAMPEPGVSMELASDDDCTYLVQKGFTVSAAQLASAIRHNLAQLQGDTPEPDRNAPRSDPWGRRRFSAKWLGNRGPKATVAVPALREIVEKFAYAGEKSDEGENELVRQSYIALARITGDPAFWLKDAGQRMLQPMLAERPRQRRYLMDYAEMVGEIFTLDSPYLWQWINSDDADLKIAAANTIYILTDDPELAAAILPLFLKLNSREELEKDIRWMDFLPLAGPDAAVAMDQLLAFLDSYLSQMQAAKWSSPEPSGLTAPPFGGAFSASTLTAPPFGAASPTVNPLPDPHLSFGAFAALRSIGGEEARKAAPALLAIYAEAPLGLPVRREIIATLKSIEVDLRPIARKWPPHLLPPSDMSGGIIENLRELAEWGPLAAPLLPELIRRLPRPDFDDEFSRVAIPTLEAIAPGDPHVKALRHLALVNQSSLDMEERQQRMGYAERP